jgi:catechol O-methyltransferase
MSRLRLPLFLRWSFIRMTLGARTLVRDWQVGDGREQATCDYVLAHAKPGSVDAAIDAIDEFARKHTFLMNVGEEKGAILDGVIERLQPQRVMELGCYVGYSGMRIARKLPAGGHLYSIEFSAANAAIARKIHAHAGVADRVTVVTGYLGDDGKTMQELEQRHGFSAGNLDVVFIDHAKEAYVPDLERILQAGWLHPGSAVVADNVRFPGAPEYKAYMDREQGKRWQTVQHETHVEYSSLVPDLMLVSTLRA